MKKLIEQLCKFGVVGISAFFVEFAMLALFKELLLPVILPHSSTDTLALIASPIAFVISTIYNYVLSVKWVFVQRTDTSHTQTFGIFVLLSLIALGLNQVLMTLFIKSFDLNAYFSKILSTFLVTLYNFISRKIFIEDHSHTDQKED